MSNLYQDKSWLSEKYLAEGLSARQIAGICGVDPVTIRNWLIKHSITPERSRQWSWRIFNPNLDPSPTLSYILGVFLGDGSISAYNKGYGVSLETIRKEFNESFEKSLRDIGLNPRTYTRYRYSRQWWITRAYSKRLFELLNNLSMEDIRRIVTKSRENIIQFIRGLYESEGSIVEHNGRLHVRISNSNTDLLELSQYLIGLIGFDTSITSGNKSFDLNILGNYNKRKSFIYIIKPVIKWGEKYGFSKPA